MKKRILSMILALVMTLSLASMLAYGAAAEGTTGLTLTVGTARGLAGDSVQLDVILKATSLPATHDHLRCWQVAFSGATLNGNNEIYFSAAGNMNQTYTNAAQNSVSATSDAGLNAGTAAQITATNGLVIGSIGFDIPATALPGDVFDVTISSVEALCFEDDSYNLYDEAGAVTVLAGRIEVMEDVSVEGLTVSLGTAYGVPGGTASVEIFVSAQSLPYTHEMLRDWQFIFSGASIHQRAQGEAKPYTVLCYPTGSDYGFVNNSKNQVGNTCDHGAYCAVASQVTARGGVWLGTVLFDVPANAEGEITVSIETVNVMHFQDQNGHQFDVKNQITVVAGKIIVLDGVTGYSTPYEGEGEDYVLPTLSADGKTRITNALAWIDDDEDVAFSGEFGALIVPAAITTNLDSVFDEVDVEKIVLKSTEITDTADIMGVLSKGTSKNPIDVYIHDRPNGLNDTQAVFDGLSSSNKKKVTLHNILEVYPEAIVDGNTVCFVAGIAVPDTDYEDLTFELDFGGRVFAQATDKIYTTITGYASVNETTAATQSIEYVENMTYLTAASVSGVPSGTYDVALTLYGRTQDALGSLITVCSETVTVTVTIA